MLVYQSLEFARNINEVGQEVEDTGKEGYVLYQVSSEIPARSNLVLSPRQLSEYKLFCRQILPSFSILNYLYY